MMVYVLSQEGQPLMPTSRYGKVRHLLKENKAKVVNKCPFTIQLLYKNTNFKQNITLGVDAGSKHIGLSASTDVKELFSSEVLLRTDVTNNISTRREIRKPRRNRLRHRKCRFLNRVRTKKKGWLAPTIQCKIDTHLKVIADVYNILPVTKLIVEVASFDTQLLKATENKLAKPLGKDYQQGEQLGFWNVREYVLSRDNHTCQCCKGKSKDKILNVHHIESRKTGGNAPNNLITLCRTCHHKYHQGLLPKFKPARQSSYRDATFMGIMRWALYDKLKASYVNVSLTYGYITKNTRIKNNLSKSHRIDALCIAQHLSVKLCDTYFLQKKVRCHNRQIHKSTILRGGKRKRNQGEYSVKGFRLFDKVKYQGREYFIFGRRKTGYFDIRTLGGEKVNKGSVSYKKLSLIDTRKTMLIQELY